MARVQDTSVRPVPGPADRDNFFAQQRRYRRRTWQLEAVCALAVLLMGVPLSIVVSPIAWSVAIVGADLVNLITPLPDVGAAMFAVLERVLGANGPASVQAMATLTAALILPGIGVMGAAWLGLRTLVRRAGTDGVLLALGARQLRGDDFEEHRLSNVVEEMAIAAGVAAPRVMLLETDAANAGAIGRGHDQAVVLVSRGLIDALDRDEIQAVIAHVIASIGNGDLPASLAMLEVVQTLGLVTMLLGSPLSRRARAGLAHLVGLALHRRGGSDEDASRVCAMLAASGEDIDADDSATSGRLRSVLALPFLTAQAAFWMNRKVFLWVLLGPALAFMWRARRYLADAMAVQLTRYPDALARALARLATEDDVVAGAAWSAHLFIVGRHAAADGRRLRALGTPSPIAPRDLARMAPTARSSRGGAAPDDPIDSILPFDPPLTKRIDHLRAAGAAFDIPRRPPPGPLVKALFVAIGGPLVALFALMLGAAALMLVYVSLALDMLFLLPAVGGLHVLLRSMLPAWLGR